MDYLKVDVDQKGEVTTETKESDGKIIVKHCSGINSENFLVQKRGTSKKLEFCMIKLNTLYYIILNGNHMMDYRKFTKIQSVENVGDDVKLKTLYFGDIILKNCDVDIITKTLYILSEWVKKKSRWYHEILYFLFN